MGSPEFGRPSELIERYVGPALRDTYDQLSGGSHGGYLGLRLMRDDPNRQSPDPAPHPKGQTLALTTSAWPMLHIFSYRAGFEGLIPHARLRALYGLFQATGEFVRGCLEDPGPVPGQDGGPPERP